MENYRPGVADRLGIGYERLNAINPALIYTSISNFGQAGPYRDYRGSEIVFYGMGGEMHSTGLADREPLKLGGNVGLYQAGAVAAVATMGAVLANSFTASPAMPPASASTCPSWKPSLVPWTAARAPCWPTSTPAN